MLLYRFNIFKHNSGFVNKVFLKSSEYSVLYFNIKLILFLSSIDLYLCKSLIVSYKVLYIFLILDILGNCM